MQAIEFTETQKPTRKRRYFTYGWFIIILVLFVFAGILQDKLLLLVAVIMFITRGIIESLFYFAKFETIINKDGVFFRGSLNKAVAFNWSVVERTEMIKVGFIGYGTWSRTLGSVFNVAGDTGLSLTMKTGKKVVIGTQKPQQLTEFLIKVDKLH